MNSEQKMERAIALGHLIAQRREELDVLEAELANLLGVPRIESEDVVEEPAPDTDDTPELELAIRDVEQKFERQVAEQHTLPSPSTVLNAIKRGVFERVLAREVVLIHLDAARGDVDVPKRFDGDSNLVLRLGHGLSPPVTDMKWDDEDLSATLTFGGVPHLCVVPWSAVFGIVGESTKRGAVWPQDAPAEVRAHAAKAPPKKAHLSLVPDAQSAPEEGRTAATRPAPELRVVPTDYGPQVLEEKACVICGDDPLNWPCRNCNSGPGVA